MDESIPSWLFSEMSFRRCLPAGKMGDTCIRFAATNNNNNSNDNDINSNNNDTDNNKFDFRAGRRFAATVSFILHNCDTKACNT